MVLDERKRSFVYAMELLSELTGNDETAMQRWLTTENTAFSGIRPIEIIKLGKAEAVLDYLEGLIDGEAAGR